MAPPVFVGGNLAHSQLCFREIWGMYASPMDERSRANTPAFGDINCFDWSNKGWMMDVVSLHLLTLIRLRAKHSVRLHTTGEALWCAIAKSCNKSLTERCTQHLSTCKMVVLLIGPGPPGFEKSQEHSSKQDQSFISEIASKRQAHQSGIVGVVFQCCAQVLGKRRVVLSVFWQGWQQGKGESSEHRPLQDLVLLAMWFGWSQNCASSNSGSELFIPKGYSFFWKNLLWGCIIKGRAWIPSAFGHTLTFLRAMGAFAGTASHPSYAGKDAVLPEEDHPSGIWNMSLSISLCSRGAAFSFMFIRPQSESHVHTIHSFTSHCMVGVNNPPFTSSLSPLLCFHHCFWIGCCFLNCFSSFPTHDHHDARRSSEWRNIRRNDKDRAADAIAIFMLHHSVLLTTNGSRIAPIESTQSMQSRELLMLRICGQPQQLWPPKWRFCLRSCLQLR